MSKVASLLLRPAFAIALYTVTMSAPTQMPPSNATGASAASGAASGPSYDETMAWLKEKIESHAGFDYRETDTFHSDESLRREGVTPYQHIPDKVGHSHVTYRYRIVSYEACQLKWAIDNHGDSMSWGDEPARLALSNLQQNGYIVHAFDVQRFGGADNDPTYPTTIEPEAASYSAVVPTLNGEDRTVPGWSFVFADGQLAQRVAKALNHAIELCGGQEAKLEPF